MFVRFLLVFDLLFILFRIALCPWKLSRWLFICVVFIFSAVLVVRVPFPFGVLASVGRIRLYRFQIIAFLSTYNVCRQTCNTPLPILGMIFVWSDVLFNITFSLILNFIFFQILRREPGQFEAWCVIFAGSCVCHSHHYKCMLEFILERNRSGVKHVDEDLRGKNIWNDICWSIMICSH